MVVSVKSKHCIFFRHILQNYPQGDKIIELKLLEVETLFQTPRPCVSPVVLLCTQL